MKHLLKHRGYYGEVYYSEEDGCYVGSVLGIRSMLAVHEDTASETIKELIESIDDYLLDCDEEGRKPNTTDPDVVQQMEAFFEKERKTDFHPIPDGKLVLALAH